MSFLTLTYAPLTAITIREVFIPPAVEPAIAPININTTRTVTAVIGQTLKSVVEYPVVVMIEATWKRECLNASSVVYTADIFVIKLIKTRVTAVAMIRRYVRNSSLRNTSLHLPIKSR